MCKELVEKARLAREILHDNTPYKESKDAIKSLFISDTGLPYREVVSLRLTVIDRYYSTNMSKRYYGIQDITSSLMQLGKNDSELVRSFKIFISNNIRRNSSVLKLFDQKYGVTKEGEDAGGATSLVSKYAYFITNYQFPIYDSLAKESYKIIARNYPQLGLAKIKESQIYSYFQCFQKLNDYFNDYDLLDNLLWLLGKIKKGNLSLIVPKKTYLLLKQDTEDLTLNKLSDAVSNVSSVRCLLGDKLCEFISFIKRLK